MNTSARRALTWILAIAPLAAGAEIIELTWDPDGRYERQLTVAPGKFAEICGPLKRHQKVAWHFDAAAPLNFNIHYHEGKNVHYPERRDAIATASGQLHAAVDQDHCWMWTNKTGQPLVLRVVLTR
jgi:hypothetical protein